LPEATEQEQIHFAGAGRILVMDDLEIIREVATELLGHLGYRAVVCSEGTEAIALYEEARRSGDPFLAVIIDLTIPGGMGGRETMKKLLEIDSQVYGIVSSGYCNDPILANYRDFGFMSVAAKPYCIEELGRILQRVRLPDEAQ
jgi:CheY-like chemotaxis protein